MHCVGGVRFDALLQEVELSHDCYVVETLVKRMSCSVATDNPGGQICSLSRHGVLEELYILDNDINDMQLSQFGITIVLLLDIDAQVILDVSLVLNSQPCLLNLLYCLVYDSGVWPHEYAIVYIV